MFKIALIVGGVLAGLLAVQTWRLDAVKADLAQIEDRFATCKADYSNILEDVRDDATIDNTDFDDLFRPDWMLDAD